MKIKQFFKKAAATVMAAVTVLSLLPTTAFAATGDVGTISFTRTYDSAGNAMYYNSSAVINGYTAGGTGKNKYRMYVDLLMTILEVHAEERDVPGLANDAHDLMDKRMRFSRLCTGPEGQDYVDIFMYESEAVEMIWQLLFAAADADMAVNDYHSRLQRGGIR